MRQDALSPPPPLPLKFPKLHSWPYTYLPRLPALGPPLPGTRRSSPPPSPPTRVKAGRLAWEPQAARILLESGKSLHLRSPRARPQLPNPRDERKGALESVGSLSTHTAVANYSPITASVLRQSIKGAKPRLTLLPLLPKARKFTPEVVWGSV